MNYSKNGSTVAVRLDVGEEIAASLKEICKKENIRFAQINGIGATDKAVVGVYDLENGVYREKEYMGIHEIVSLVGSVTEKDGEPYLHAHIALAGQDGVCRGGHLLSAYIGITGEIFLNICEGELKRRVNPATGLNIFDL